VRTLTSDPENRVPHLAFQPGALSDTPILPIEDIQTSYYLRMQAADRPGVLADVTRIFGDQEISIEAVIQKEPMEDANDAAIIMLTQKNTERRMNSAIKSVEALDAINGKITRIRVEHLKKN